jgi:hypothetical protein
MKKIMKAGATFLSAGVLALALVGCAMDNATAPTTDESTSLGTEVQPNWIVLPEPDNQSLAKMTSVTKTINGSDESLLEINTGYAGGPFGWVSITANARFQRYAFTGTRTITMAVSDQCGVADFSPSGTWAKPVIYNLTIQGIDLSKVDPSKVKFVYVAPDGKYYTAVCQSIYVEKQSGKLQVINAQLPHFSRYSFGI